MALPWVPIGIGIGILSGGSSKAGQRRTQKAQFQFQELQARSSAKTARLNAAILGTQSEAFIRQQGEVITDITEEGESVYAERAALAAAEGFGGGGTARSAQAGIRRKVSRDVTRVRDFLAEQTEIFNLQREQQLEQASAFETQATFAAGQVKSLKKPKFNPFKPSTWF